jgi:putative ABC transport system permease protein
MTPVAARSVTTGRRQRQVTAALVVAEISLAFMLLSGAGLLTRSLGRVLAVDPGFNAANLLTLSITASGSRYQADSAVWRMQSVLLRTLETNPGVLSAAMASQIPLGGNVDQYGVVIEDQPLANPEDVPSADRYAVSPGYVATMQIPLRRGRDFTPEDRGGAVPVALINETFARLSWPGTDPIGKRIRLGGEQRPWRTIIGIVGDVQHVGLDSRPAPQVYLPAEQWMWAENGFDLVLRTRTSPAQLTPQVRAAIAAVDPALAIQDVAGAEDLVAATTADRRLIVRLFEAFAVIALLLAAAGIYGLLSRRVAERQRELGIRAALGATRRAILEHVLRDGGRLAALGVIIGVGGALGVSRLLESLLFGVAPRDPLTLTAAGGLLAAVALVACLLPALRAARVDPVDVLRNE